MRPLEGVTVIELSTMITASLATMMMAKQGATAIKVEPIGEGEGDPMRYLRSAKGGMSGLFANCNRGKSSVRINLKDPAGQGLVAQLARTADPTMGSLRVMKMPARFGGQRLPPAAPSPDHGEHTGEVLAGLGMSADEIDQLRAQGVVA